MNQKEREQAKVFEQLKQTLITRAEAAARLAISLRWLRKKYKRYLAYEDVGLVHKARGCTKGESWDSKHGVLLEELLKGDWHDFGPKFTAEKLGELHKILVSKETVRQVMIKRGLWKPKQKKQKHRARRERRAMIGLMSQLDGSPHDWFEGRGPNCTLLVFIDDATSQILWLEFAESESMEALMRASKNYILKHGIPHTFYVDHGSVFHVHLNNAEHEKRTQWERAVEQLGIEVIHAHSPQAKGRVERCNRTMQDRLVKDMRTAKVSSIEEANAFLQTSSFIEKHNNQFPVKPAKKGNAHRDAQEYDLDDIFSIYETRILANDFTITYYKRIFQLEEQRLAIVRPKDEIMVCVRLDGSIHLKIRRTELPYHEIKTRPSPEDSEQKQVKELYYKRSENSKRWVSGKFPLSRVKSAVPAVEAQLK